MNKVRGAAVVFILLALLTVVGAWAFPEGTLEEWGTSPLRPYDIVVLPDGSAWLSFFDKELRSDVGKVFTINPADGSTREFEAPFPALFGTMDRSPDNGIWIGDYHHRIVHFHAASGVFTRYELPADMFSRPDGLAEYMGVSTAPDGRVWFTYWDDTCLGMFDPAAETWQRFPLPAGGEHPPGVPVEIAFGPDGTVWFTIREWGPGKAGLGNLDPRTGEFTLWTDPALFPDRCFPVTRRPRTPWGIVVDDGLVWFADHTSSCLIRYDPLRPEEGFGCFPMPLEDGTMWDTHHLDVDGDGVFWLTAYGIDALITFDPETEHFDSLMLAEGSKPMGISVSPAGEVWWAESFDPGRGGVGRFRPSSTFPVFRNEPPWIPERPLRNLFLIDCGPCPHCFDSPCDPRVNPDHDKFIVWDPRRNIIESFSLSRLGLKPEEGPLAAAAPVLAAKGQLSFVATAPNAKGGAGAILFFNRAGEVIKRIDGQTVGERLGFDIDVRGDLVVVASKQRLLVLEGQKVIIDMSLPPELSPQRGVRVAFTDDSDGDKRPDILLGAPYAKVAMYREAGQIQLIGSRSGKTFLLVQGRATGEHMGELLQPMDLNLGRPSK